MANNGIIYAKEIIKEDNSIELANNAVSKETVFSSDIYSGNYSSNIFGKEMVRDIEEDTLMSYINDYSSNQNEIEGILSYYYLSNPSIFQNINIPVSINSLNSKIKCIGDDAKSKEIILTLKKHLVRINDKELTRGILAQVLHTGTVHGIWLGGKKDVYPYIFDDNRYVKAIDRRYSGEFAIGFDLDYISNLDDLAKITFFEMMNPYITESQYNDFLSKGEDFQYIILPKERTFVIRNASLYHNQRSGVPVNLPIMRDIVHKNMLKELEKNNINKAYKNIYVATVGEKISDSNINTARYDWNNITNNQKITIASSLRRGLKSQEETTAIILPQFVQLDNIKVDLDGLGKDKFEIVDKDINIGTSGVDLLLNGDHTDKSKMITIDLLYKQIATLLEVIEHQVYLKMFNLLLSKKQQYSYILEYDKSTPITKKETVDVLERLNTAFGLSLRDLLENIGIDFEAYMSNTRYEQDDLQISDTIKPYSSTFTQSGDSQTVLPKETKDKQETVEGDNIDEE